MNFSIQTPLENDKVSLLPLQEGDFEALYQTASDEKIWLQHPNKDRWKKEVFQSFFEGAIASQGAFKIIDKATGKIAGSTRFYNYIEAEKTILIGYTFYATQFWGTGINTSVKKLMMDYIFQYVDKVQFHVGAENIRSQIAVGRLGATKIAEEQVAYYGEQPKLNFVFEINNSL
ncbi:GNAT family N-acetyltransferase [Pedobacter sp. MC2016-24]|uniref:GNAT family N-acetyltransferase n=1 Tax=Pedobacter sp. MC2016-24 TaxID=2780090 RepID=UPI0018810719|nr:GNAT family N-acetyltransferase [Pedobacter sp. MC2016-24]MBE9600839.1 GNAT family N-acetyltransferase [Pedobacter sp. MC2016-24]